MYDHKLLDKVTELIHDKATPKTRQTVLRWLLNASVQKKLEIKTIDHEVMVETDGYFGVCHHYRNRVVKKRNSEELVLPLTKVDDFVILKTSPKDIIIVLYTKEAKEVPPL